MAPSTLALADSHTCSHSNSHHTVKEKGNRKDYAFWRQFNEKPRIVPEITITL